MEIARFDAVLTDKHYLVVGDQIIDVSAVPSPRRHSTEGEKTAAKAGRSPEG
jgi:hypothetical protein